MTARRRQLRWVVLGLAASAVMLLGVEEGCTVPTPHSWGGARCVEPLMAGRTTSRVLVAYCNEFGDPVADPDRTRFEVVGPSYVEIQLTPSGRPFLSVDDDAPVGVQESILIRKLVCTDDDPASCAAVAQAQSTVNVPRRVFSDARRKNLEVAVVGGGSVESPAGCRDSGDEECLVDCAPGRGTCRVSQVDRTVVDLAGQAAPGYACGGWSCDDGTSSTTCDAGVRLRKELTRCTLQLDPEPDLHELAVDLPPPDFGTYPGYGTVSVRNAGGSELCSVGPGPSPDCTVARPAGETVDLVATPLAPVYRFEGWSGACAPEGSPDATSATLSVALDEPFTDCRAHFDFGCRPDQLQVDFSVDGIPFDAFPSGEPGVYDAPDPGAVELLAWVSGPAANATGVVHRWEFRPFDAAEEQPWQPVPGCALASPRCLWDARVEPDAAQVRLTVEVCRSELVETVGPTQSPDGSDAWVDLFL